MRFAAACEAPFSVCAVHRTRRIPSPGRCGWPGSSRQYCRRRPIALDVTYVRCRSGKTSTHAISTLRFVGDASTSPINPANVPPPCALSMIANRIHPGSRRILDSIVVRISSRVEGLNGKIAMQLRVGSDLLRVRLCVEGGYERRQLDTLGFECRFVEGHDPVDIVWVRAIIPRWEHWDVRRLVRVGVCHDVS